MKPLYAILVIITLTVILPSCGDPDTTSKILVNDPLFEQQWHLENNGQKGGVLREDINVVPVWEMDIFGHGIYVSVVDDGLEIDHEDLEKNISLQHNYNYSDGSTDTSGSGNCANDDSGCHGTNIGGVIAATGNNKTGGTGIAPAAKLVAYNLLAVFDSTNQYNAMTRNIDVIDISNNSWGPPDYTGHLTPADDLWIAGIEEGLATGRDGKGTVYIWAGGNGVNRDEVIDNSNYDGYANHHGVIAVAAIGDNGLRSYYSESGANIWVCAPSSSSAGASIVTTDKMGDEGYSYENYYYNFGGTSAAAPSVAGVAALVLEASPDLTWRDIKLILAESARQNDAYDNDWRANSAGYYINHKYGFGAVDAEAAVLLARDWTVVSKQIIYDSTVSTAGISIPAYDYSGASDTITVASSGITEIEYVAIDITIDHTCAGDLEIVLTSPGGTESILSEKHACYNEDSGAAESCGYFTGGNTFRFATGRCLGESPAGQWTLTIKDIGPKGKGSFTEWRLKIYGR